MTEDKPALTSNDSPLFQVKASFVQHSLPGLEAGKYTVTAQQKMVKQDNTSVTNGDLPVVTRSFGVEGHKYTIPSKFIHSEFPPKTTEGEFSTALPQLVLTGAEKLPWIRSPYYKDEPTIVTHSYEVDGETHRYDDDKATWLFVLPLSQTDFGGVSPGHLVQQGTVADLIPDTMKVRTGSSGDSLQGTLPSKSGYSSFSYVFESGTTQPAGTVLDPGVGYDAKDAIRYIDIPVALFQSLAPTMQDLEMMAHVRSVKMDNKALADGAIIDAEGDYAVVMGNRLPQSLPASAAKDAKPGQIPPGANDAFVVSLENLECALRDYADTSYFETTIVPATDGFVRLTVLYQWNFISYDSTSFAFEELLEGLNGRVPSQTNPDTTPLSNPSLRLPDPPDYHQPTEAQNAVQTMLSLGYVPMNHLTRVPDTSGAEPEPIQTMSWYRGPLTPFAVAPDANGPLGGGAVDSDPTEAVFSADKLLRFDPTLGLYDTSYAAAWQLGRLIALQDKSFSTAYYQWQRGHSYSLRASFETDLLTRNFATFHEATPPHGEAVKTALQSTLFKTAVGALVAAVNQRGTDD